MTTLEFSHRLLGVWEAQSGGIGLLLDHKQALLTLSHVFNFLKEAYDKPREGAQCPTGQVIERQSQFSC